MLCDVGVFYIGRYEPFLVPEGFFIIIITINIMCMVIFMMADVSLPPNIL